MKKLILIFLVIIVANVLLAETKKATSCVKIDDKNEEYSLYKEVYLFFESPSINHKKVNLEDALKDFSHKKVQYQIADSTKIKLQENFWEINKTLEDVILTTYNDDDKEITLNKEKLIFNWFTISEIDYQLKSSLTKSNNIIILKEIKEEKLDNFDWSFIIFLFILLVVAHYICFVIGLEVSNFFVPNLIMSVIFIIISITRCKIFLLPTIFSVLISIFVYFKMNKEMINKLKSELEKEKES